MNARAAGDSPQLPADARLLRTQKLCERRAFRERDVQIAKLVGEIARDATRTARRQGGAAEAWEKCMPADLVAETWIESASAAAWMIGVTSSAAAFAVDRALRGGALQAIRVAMNAPALRIRTRIGRMPGP